MTTRSPALARTPSQPLVNCVACEFAWYGRTAAHGLSVIGSCPRCGGPLHFHGDSSGPERFEREARDVQPWQVLGTPTSWDAA